MLSTRLQREAKRTPEGKESSLVRFTDLALEWFSTLRDGSFYGSGARK